MRKLSDKDIERIINAGCVFEVDQHHAGTPESITESEELCVTFADGTELLVYINAEGELTVEVD